MCHQFHPTVCQATSPFREEETINRSSDRRVQFQDNDQTPHDHLKPKKVWRKIEKRARRWRLYKARNGMFSLVNGGIVIERVSTGTFRCSKGGNSETRITRLNRRVRRISSRMCKARRE